jgi:hypothetical protein
MSYVRTLRRWILRLLGKRVPRADEVVRPDDLLKGPAGEAVVLPSLPETGRGPGGIEFASANVLERNVLGAIVRRDRPARIFEIGTFRGITALSMAANCSWESVLWTLDLPPELSAAEVNERFYSSNPKSGFQSLARANAGRNVGVALAGFKGPCRVEQLFGDAATFDFGPYSPVDLFFVDGCHEYDAAKRDRLAAWRALRPGGRIVWHDYKWKSVERAIRDALPGVRITWVEGTSIAFAAKP